jgi:hypothetical protein
VRRSNLERMTHSSLVFQNTSASHAYYQIYFQRDSRATWDTNN